MDTPNGSTDAAITSGMLRWFEDHAAQGMFTTDCDLIIRSWNHWLETATSLDAADVIGRPLFEVVPSLVERGVDQYYREAVAGLSKVLSHTLHRQLLPSTRGGGEPMPQSARIAPLMDGERVVGVITLIEDVSERVMAEKHLRSQIALAEAARAQVELTSRAKDEFLATLSHEIRTPLSAVLGWVHLLKVREPDAVTLKRGLEVIERNAKSQLTLITDMLDMARISSGKMRLELTTVNMTAVVSGAIDAARPAAAAKQVRLVADLSPGVATVNGDADRLLQVTWNLLNNAVKFTGEGGLVVVSLNSDRTGTHLTVADSGQGIEPAFLPQVFDRFKQADTSTARKSGGLGLGLALVKDLVAMHGGSVQAASPGPGMGSTFSVHLPSPVDRGEAAEGTTPDRSVATLNGVRVLIVEDDADAQEIAERSITDAGGSAVVVGNATEALAAIASGATRLDALISDIGLPGTDGYSLLAAVRRLPNARGTIPAIAVTAYASPVDVRQAIERGFAAHIAKPYTPATLVAALREALDQV